MIDVHTIGAGGGSIAYVDRGGAFRVGPRSAGAVPGPAAYGRGGTEPTVTDANVVLGRLAPEDFLGGGMKLDTAASHSVVSRACRQAWPRSARNRRRHPHRHQQQHGERDPLAHRSEGRRSPRLFAGRFRRCRPASRRRGRRHARDSGGRGAACIRASRPPWGC